MSSGTRYRFALLLLGVLLSGVAATAEASTNVTVQAQLVWGTNLKESSSKDHKPIDGKTAEDLRKWFKWQNYFVIKSETVDLVSGKLHKLKMSDKCIIEIKFVGNNKFEVMVVGEGERVAKGTQMMPPGEKVFLGGGGENESSWLVILKQKSGK